MANGTLAASQIEMLSQSGTGIITITPPATNTNRAITLPDAAGAIVVSGTTPSLNGITFPATQVASADANTLYDYEEGTWTPTDTSGAGLTFTSIQAFYTKVGRMVTLNASFTFPSTASAAGISIGGIPFPYNFSNSENCMSIFDYAGLGANQVYFANSAFDIRAAGSATVRTNAQFSLIRIHVMVSYSTSA